MKQTAADYHIRTMRQEDLALALEWARQEGWNPGLADAALFMRADPQGFFVGQLRGQPVATLSAVKYGADFGFIGLYIVHPDFRGHGLGLRLWQHGMDYLAGRNMGLDGVPAQQDNYRKSGFQLAYRNIRFAGRTAPSSPQTPLPVVNLQSPAHSPEQLAQWLEQVLLYDHPLFPAPRTAFLQDWLLSPQAQARAVVENGLVRGYGAIRTCRSGYKIGPLHADDAELAETLFSALCAAVPPDAPVFLDVPEPNPQALALAARHQMQACFETARMYTRTAPALDLNRIFGITSFELG